MGDLRLSLGGVGAGLVVSGLRQVVIAIEHGLNQCGSLGDSISTINRALSVCSVQQCLPADSSFLAQVD